MKTLSLLLVVIHFFTGALNSMQSQLLGAFNIFNPNYSLEQFTRNLNLLIGPIRNSAYPDLKLEAKSAIILDQASGRTLFSKNTNEQLPMASITKIMTAIVVLDNSANLDAVVTVPREATEVTGSRMYLYENESLTIRDLLKGMLIESANDAALTLAIRTAGSVDKFVRLMNAKAAQLGLFNTHFVNPTGFDDPNHYSTAKDIASLARIALMNSIFADIVSINKATVYDTTHKFSHQLNNTNKLVGEYRNVVGVKTGTTDEAGESLVVSARGDSGQEVIAVLLNSPNRFEEGKKALDWALKAYSWVEVA